LLKIVFEVNKLVIAYIMQQRGMKDFQVSGEKWNRLLKEVYDGKEKLPAKKILEGLDEEYVAAKKFEEIVEHEWKQCEKNVVAWLKELTKVDFKDPKVKVCVVPFAAGEIPSRNIPLVVVGKIRKGWGYPETIAHELAHIMFNQNFNFEREVEHPYVQLIEEEIAVRLGARSKYFDYEIPAFAEWVHKAQQMERAWRRYLQQIEDFRDISQFIKENEEMRNSRTSFA
jgi:hypothetical protein